jgi:tRNA threonylcarbamoyladenosine biosynthesis protein TsaE
LAARTSLQWDGLNEEALEALAIRVAGSLKPADVVVLKGEVGTGKSTFVRTAAHALGIQEPVTSPTYQFARDYEGSIDGHTIAVNHIDLYRLQGLDARDSLDLDEYLRSDSITFIEWADLALEFLEEPNIVEFFYRSPETRRVRISGPIAARL